MDLSGKLEDCGGVVRKRKKFAAKTKHEAMDKDKSFLDEQNKGVNISRQNVTVAEWIEACMENYVKPRIRPRTYEKYLSSIKNYILLKFGKIKLLDLEASSLQRHFNSLLTDERTVKDCRILQFARQDATLQCALMTLSEKVCFCVMFEADKITKTHAKRNCLPDKGRSNKFNRNCKKYRK